MSGTRLAGKVALITGAAGGLGVEIARRFQEEGATVFVTDVINTGEETAATIGATYLRLDIRYDDDGIPATDSAVASCEAPTVQAGGLEP